MDLVNPTAHSKAQKMCKGTNKAMIKIWAKHFPEMSHVWNNYLLIDKVHCHPTPKKRSKNPLQATLLEDFRTQCLKKKKPNFGQKES